jgi:glyoxylase-like metal-dependent hydrolase (beta-lactamase superfamily II)
MPTLEWRLYEAGYCTHPERATQIGGSLRACEFPALVSVLRHPERGIILFDTGYSRHFFRATERFPERLYRMVTPVHLHDGAALSVQLEREGISASAIAWVIVSHLHGDHVGGLADFPHSRIALSREAWDDMQGRSRVGALSMGLLPALVDAHAQARLQWFEDRPMAMLSGSFKRFGSGYDLFGDRSLLLIALPGHAAGHYGVLFEDGSGPVFLIADASWSSQAIREFIPPPALVTGWLGDTHTYRDTLAKLSALHTEAPELRIVPSHCREWRPERSPTDA